MSHYAAGIEAVRESGSKHDEWTRLLLAEICHLHTVLPSADASDQLVFRPHSRSALTQELLGLGGPQQHAPALPAVPGIAEALAAVQAHIGSLGVAGALHDLHAIWFMLMFQLAGSLHAMRSPSPLHAQQVAA